MREKDAVALGTVLCFMWRMSALELKKSMSQKLRMTGRDYSRIGWYFITLGADYHRYLFGVVEGCAMRPNELGWLVERCWAEIPQHYGHIELGAWQVMPNHFHGLVRIIRPGGKWVGRGVEYVQGFGYARVAKGGRLSLWRESTGLGSELL